MTRQDLASALRLLMPNTDITSGNHSVEDSTSVDPRHRRRWRLLQP